MGKRSSKYKRCKKCKELVIDTVNCANCRDRDPAYNRRNVGYGKKGSPTMDIQEGNDEGRG